MGKRLTKAEENENEILNVLKAFTECGVREIAELIGKPEGTVHGIAHRMKAKGLIEFGSKDHKTANRTMKVRTLIMVDPAATVIKKDAENQLLKDLAELRAFKARAIQSYPDLDADPLVLEARAILADQVSTEHVKQQVLSGVDDTSAAIRAIVAALSKKAA